MIKKAISILAIALVVTVAAVALSACKSKDTSQTSSTSSAQAKRLEQWKNDLAELVKDGTINQSQSNDILEALSTMNQQYGTRPSGNYGSGSRPSRNYSGTRPSGSWSGTRPSGSWSGTRPSGSGGNGGFSNPLSSLVQQGILTQDQANTVMKKLFSNMRTGTSGTTSQTTSGTNA